MRLRHYETNRWLWFGLSLTVFVVLGIVPLLEMKGESFRLFGIFAVVPRLVSGKPEFADLAMLGVILLVWITVAAAVGRLVHNAAVIIFSPRHERSGTRH